MPDPRILVIAAGLAMAYWAGTGIVRGVKHVAHQTNCIVRTGHKCPSKPAAVQPKQ